jgi:hypothetical protein
MKKILFVLSILLVTGAAAQHKIVNDPLAQTRNVKPFHEIRVSNGIHLYLTQSNEEAVAVSASETKYRDRIHTEVEDGVLKIYYEHGNWNFSDDEGRRLKAYVSCKVLDGLKGSSGANVDVDGDIRSDNLRMNFSSGASFSGKIAVTDLHIEQGSGAETNISGSATRTRVEGSSGSSFKGYDLVTENCDASCSSGATVRITVKKELSASASSGGQIYYKGEGMIRDISTSSGGEVSRR